MILLLNSLLVYLIFLIVILLSVAFFTLLERKILGYVQLRKGPNKVGVAGLLQPFADGLSLFLKEYQVPNNSNWIMFIFTPAVGLILSLVLWLIVPVYCHWFDFWYAILFLFCLSSFNVYFVVGSGWFSNSKYALLGSYRAVAQMISYEVSMILILMSIVMVESRYVMFMEVDWVIVYGFGFFVLFFLWLLCCLAETNRSPFDFAEAESELVSGYNVEYGSGGFAMLFLAEYSNILLMSMVSSLIFFNSYGGLLILSFWFLWVRATFPRLRYDSLMMMVWKVYLPCALSFLVLIIGWL